MGLFAQSQKKLLRQARHFADNGDYYSSEEKYLKILKKDSLHIAANMELGLILNEYTENPLKAGPFLLRGERALKKDTVPELIYEIGRYYHMTGNFEKAKSYFSKLLKYQITTKEGMTVRTIILKDIADCDYAIKNNNKIDPRFLTQNIGGDVNTVFPEYVPVITANNNSLIFTSRRKSNRHNKVDYADMKYYEDIFLAKSNNGKFQDSVRFLQDGREFNQIKNSKLNESVISISHDGKKLFFFKKRRVLESDFDGVSWSEPRELAKKINFDFYQNHASISPDGNTIYFTSETKKGDNGSDIYMATKDSNGIWSTAINLGDAINTLFDEDSPFIDIDGKTLYFSSDGREGFGGYDIYKSTYDGKNWSKPINLGLPVNSPCDDFDFTLNDVGNKGYFSSGRIGGFGDLDIYHFSYDNCENFTDTSNYFTQNQKAFLKEPVTFDGTRVNLYNEKVISYYWFVNDIFMLKEAKTFDQTFDSIGTYYVKMQVQTNDHNYCYTDKITVEHTKTQYDSLMAVNEKNNLANNNANNSNNGNNNGNSNNNSNNNSNTNNNGNNNNNLNNDLNNANAVAAQDFATIYFDFNKSSLSDDALIWLNKLVETLKLNPTAAINIASHCDSRGSSAYNQALSNNRSQSIIRFLLKSGIKRKQIKSIKNLGESNPVNTCDDNANCDDTQHALNRRAQLSLIK